MPHFEHFDSKTATTSNIAHKTTVFFITTGIKPESLDSSEQNKLNQGLACSVRHVLKQRSAKSALFEKDLTGLRNDLALRRELRKPLAKVLALLNILSSSENLI